MSKNTNLSFLTDYITADITNGRIGINTPSPAYAFDVTGLERSRGTTASDTAPLGSELAAVTGTGTNWTLAGGATNLNVGGYTHTVGSTTALTTSLAAVVGTYYQITYTITGRTAGSITIAYGGASKPDNQSSDFGPLASSTAVLTITPSTDFDGTVVISIKSIGTSSASSTFSTSTGATALEIRASNITSNIFIGNNAGRRVTTGSNNVFIGQSSGTNNTTGVLNTFIGTSTGNSNTTGGYNSFLGYLAGTTNTTGSSNTFIGTNAGQSNTTGGNNSFFGVSAGSSNITGTFNTFLGNSAGQYSNGSYNTSTGNASLQSNSSGNQNTAIGQGASQANTTGSFNISVGQIALQNNTSGSSNIALGQQAGRYISDGATGNSITNTSIYIGTNTKALANNQSNQIVIGDSATGLGSNTTVLGNSSTVTTAIYGNLGLGTTSPNDVLELKSASANNPNLRLYSTFNAGASAYGINWYRDYDSATNAIAGYIRYNRGGGSDGDMLFGTGTNAGVSERMRITSGGRVLMGGTSDNGLGTLQVWHPTGGAGLMLRNGSDLVLEPASLPNNLAGFYNDYGSIQAFVGGATGAYCNGTTWVNGSDIRLKKDINTITFNGLDAISLLRPVSYKFISDEKEKERIGFIAQEIQEVLPQVVDDSSGEHLGVDYGSITAALVKAIQELSAEINILKNK